MSNLCQEITLPADPIQHIDKSGQIALCILSAINVGKLKNLDELDELCDLAAKGLDALIDYQEYPVSAAKQSTVNRRSLGVVTLVWHITLLSMVQTMTAPRHMTWCINC